MKKCQLLVLLLLGLSVMGLAQPVGDSINHKRLNTLLISGGTAYAGAMIALNQVWYAQHERESFHFFNDNAEWKQMDKVGHFYSAFYITDVSARAFQWTGIDGNKSYFYGLLTGVALMAPIEILDGFSTAYGASVGDFVANTAGSWWAYTQYRWWGEIRIKPKMSFHTTGWPKERPNVLGHAWHEQLMKDYNGQTYWLSFNISRFLPESSFPKWLNVALGYSADGMVYARDHQNRSNGYGPAQRNYYLTLDLDLSEYKTQSPWLNALIYLADVIHWPMPTIGYEGNSWKMYGLYY